jgi:hypothetical protein
MPRYVTGRATELVDIIELRCAPGDVVLIIPRPCHFGAALRPAPEITGRALRRSKK